MFDPLAEFHIELEVEGATEEDLARGVAAAYAVFEANDVDPWDGACASHAMEWSSSGEVGLSEAEFAMGIVYMDAIEAALMAACADLPDTPKQYDFCVLWNDAPRRIHGPEVLEVVRPFTTYGLPEGHRCAAKPGKRRKLVGWYWEWDYVN